MSNKTIKISKESMERFNHDKNVVNMSQSEIAELCKPYRIAPEELFKKVFDKSECVVTPIDGAIVATGIINGVPAVCKSIQKSYACTIQPILKKSECNYDSWENVIFDRLSNERMFADMVSFNGGYYHIWFYYRPNEG